MKKSQLKEIIRQEISEYLMEAPYDDEEKRKDNLEKEKQNIEKQKMALAQKKQDFTQKQSADKDREQDKEDAEKEAEDNDKNDNQGQETDQVKSNIKFNTQGQYYEDAYYQVKNIVLSDDNILSDEEVHFISLAVEASKGRFDKGFERFLRNGYAGNVYGKDFSDKDIKIIMNYVKKMI